MIRIVYNLAGASDGSCNIGAGGQVGGFPYAKNEYGFLFEPNSVPLRSMLFEMYSSSNEPSRRYATSVEPRSNNYGAARSDDPRFQKRLRRVFKCLATVRPQGAMSFLLCSEFVWNKWLCKTVMCNGVRHVFVNRRTKRLTLFEKPNNCLICSNHVFVERFLLSPTG